MHPPRSVIDPQPPLHVVYGCNGPVGTTLMERLQRGGRRVRGVCRSGRATAPAGVEVLAGDATDAADVAKRCRGAAVVYCCIGIDYTRWMELWPRIVDGLIEGVARAGSRLVFTDNLYAYGPVHGPLTEDLPLTGYGRKPALRAKLARRLLDAHGSGKLPVAIARASDFFGPRVLNSLLGVRVFAAALQGRTAQLIGDIDQPHTYTYVPDLARALATLAISGSAFGEVWHVPSPPPQSTRSIVERVYALAGQPPAMRSLPRPLLAVLGLFWPIMRELRELQFQWDRPYIVDHGKFADAYWGDYTPLDDGLRTTLAWYRDEYAGR